jgi:hypothetical protein
MAPVARRLLSDRCQSCRDNGCEHTEADNPVRSLADSYPVDRIQFLFLDADSLVAMLVTDVIRRKFRKQVREDIRVTQYRPDFLVAHAGA